MTKIKDKIKQPDTLWKEIIKDLFEDFITFFIEDLAKEIDFSKGVEFLDKELSKLSSKGETKNRDADTLVKVFLKNGEEKWVLVHIEVQGYKEEDFSKRMFTYYYRILDRYGKETTAIAILTDENKDFKPNKYEKEFYGTELNYKYNSFKILGKSEKELKENKNPFAMIILAGLYVIKSKKITDEKKKFLFKMTLAKLLRDKKYSAEKRRSIFIFIESIIKLPSKLELQFEKETDNLFDEEETMPLTVEDMNIFQVKKDMAVMAEKTRTAKEMLKDGLGLDKIAKYVGLKLEELKKLLKK